MSEKDLLLPDIGDFKGVEVIELLVAVGDSVKAEDSLLTLESDKASMDIPSPYSGTIKKLNVAVGDKISEGDLLGKIEISEGATEAAAANKDDNETNKEQKSASPSQAKPDAGGDADIETEVVVLGAGPGGYTAAFRAADLGKKVVLVERYDSLGGVCLNVGCIPSKALLHTAQIINEAAHMQANGVTFGKPRIDLDGINGFKDKVVGKLTGGLSGLAKQRKVTVVHGVGQFLDANNLAVEKDGKTTQIRFDNCIIAAGSQATEIPPFPNDDERLMDSTDALLLTDVPKKLLIVGGGIIGPVGHAG